MVMKKVGYLVVAEFCSRVEINPDDLKNENYDELVKQFSEALLEKIRNDEVLENIISIKEDVEYKENI
jgi:hypothetical protein